jgi:hypothetical protein
MQVKPLPLDNSIIKETIRDADDWQTPRAPFLVTFRMSVTPVTHDLDIEDISTDTAQWQQHQGTMGGGAMPPGVELALNSMAVTEVARYTMPASMLQVNGKLEPWCGSSTVKHSHIMHVLLELSDTVEVRDMTGDGKVRSRRLSHHPRKCSAHA